MVIAPDDEETPHVEGSASSTGEQPAPAPEPQPEPPVPEHDGTGQPAPEQQPEESPQERRLRLRMPPPLPARPEDWIDQRKVVWTLNDHVQRAHRALNTDQNYRRLLFAVYDEQTIEGSLAADNIMAAKMIRDLAEEHAGYEEILGQKLTAISKALGVVLRRYGQSRKQRRNMLGGQIVRDDENGEP